MDGAGIDGGVKGASLGGADWRVLGDARLIADSSGRFIPIAELHTVDCTLPTGSSLSRRKTAAGLKSGPEGVAF